MDALYERNITEVLTTIVSNIITFTLLGVSTYVRFPRSGMDETQREKGISVPTWRTYLQVFMELIYFPIKIVDNATEALRYLIKGACMGMPYKYIRLLSSVEYFIGYNSQEEFDKDNSGSNYKTTQQDEDDNDSVNFCEYRYTAEHIEDTELPKVWLPKYWPEKIMYADYCIYVPPNQAYISDPTFDGMYSLKSSTSCLFGAVQCISAIVISCMRLQNINTMHTMDVLSMYTSYMLLCIVINLSFLPGYHVKPLVCIPVTELKSYQKISSKMAHPKLRRRIYMHFQRHRWGYKLISILLLIPICLMVALLIYINKNNTLLLSLSAAWVFTFVFGEYFNYFLERIFPLLKYHVNQYFVTAVTGCLLISLIVCSCLNVTTEQKYPSNVNWLPHF
jgi:hypothetical protein